MAERNKSEELDMGYLLDRFGYFFKRLVRGFFLMFDFFKKYAIALVIIIIIGVGIGIYKEYTNVKSYNNEVIVIPNFGSVDYLYDKIEEINLKIGSNDTVYLKQVLGPNFSKLKLIKIEPIVDLYNFISESRQNIDILRIISQNQDFSEYVENLATSKYYKYHRMQVTLQGKDSSEKIINDLLAYFNKNRHFQQYQKIFKKVKDFEIQEHYTMLAQLDSLIKANYNIQKQAASVSVSNNTDQFNLVEKKRQIIEDLEHLEIQQDDYDIPIKKVSVNYNMTPDKLFVIPKTLKYPLIFVFLFSLIFFILYILKSLKKYADSN